MTKPLPLPKNPRFALLIVDMQAYFFQKVERRVGLEAVISRINSLVDSFDNASQPVVHVCTAYSADQSDWDLKMLAGDQAELIRGTSETDILFGIKVKSQHHHQRKTRYSAFFNTDLAQHLHSARVDAVVVVGSYTHYCVNATIFDAFGHNFVPFLVSDAVMSHLPEESLVMIDRMKRNGYYVLTTDKFLSRDAHTELS